MENDLIAIELIIDYNVEVILFLSHINGHVDAFSRKRYGNRIAVVLVLHEECEVLLDSSKFVGDKGE